MDESAHTPEHDPRVRDPDGRAATEPAPPAHLDGLYGLDGHEVADDAPLTRLDADVEQHVRTLLAGAADPGPMPDAVSERISGALLDAARLRVDPGPLSASRSGSDAMGTDDADHDTVLAMPTRAVRPKPIYLVAAVAAAAAVVAVGASALHVTKRPNGAAVVGDTYASGATTSPPSPPGTSGGLHIQLSTTAYTAGTLATQARALLDHPGQPIRDLAAESPGIGPIATPIGLEACLEEIGAVGAADPAPDAVSADLATFAGRPAVVVVVTRAGASTAWAVERSCTTGAPGLLAGATPVP
ncbi:hypothetical protein ASE25_05305 [Terrabacter sp. Root85]|uniref:hypothetical protein n=1 Tax=Terrabacter sp. Root85 TaxID=1736603 RepID=UPI0006FD3291|nr:hypothetical protein [Terrabacter sp. Root85]KRC92729.1 hypothetical protein ASE25_05305 [Terrabacter sp. Root85]